MLEIRRESKGLFPKRLYLATPAERILRKEILQLLELDGQDGKLLIDVVMQLACDTRPLLLLSIDQASTQVLAEK